MGEVSLEKALEKLSSDKQKERTEGLTGVLEYLILYFICGTTDTDQRVPWNKVSRTSCSKTKVAQDCKLSWHLCKFLAVQLLRIIELYPALILTIRRATKYSSPCFDLSPLIYQSSIELNDQTLEILPPRGCLLVLPSFGLQSTLSCGN